jgi:hypothetical protein
MIGLSCDAPKHRSNVVDHFGLGDSGDNPQRPLLRIDKLPREEMLMQPQRYGPFPYVPINRRLRITWPHGARVALWVIPNIRTKRSWSGSKDRKETRDAVI